MRSGNLPCGRRPGECLRHLDCTDKAAELFPDLPYNQAAFVRTRINALMEYLIQMQAK